MSKEQKQQTTTKPMAYDALLCGVFLQELADKHGVDVTKLMVGKIGKELYVWRFDTAADDVFKTLEIIPLSVKRSGDFRDEDNRESQAEYFGWK